MLTVVSSSSEPHHLGQLRKWIAAEWGQTDPLKAADDGFVVPSPLLVIDGEKLFGGLTFTNYPKPGIKETGLWINALFVAPAHRGVGIGSQLVEAAEVEAANIRAEELFVYTNVPGLYQKLGWLEVDSSGEHTVLKRTLGNG